MAANTTAMKIAGNATFGLLLVNAMYTNALIMISTAINVLFILIV